MASRHRYRWFLRQCKEGQHPQHDDSHHNPLHELLAGRLLYRKRSAGRTCHISTTSSAPTAKIPSPGCELAWRRLGELITAHGFHVAARSWRDLAAPWIYQASARNPRSNGVEMSITGRRRLQIFSKHIPFTVSILRPSLGWTTANRNVKQRVQLGFYLAQVAMHKIRRHAA
jgi:hypothetical protein